VRLSDGTRIQGPISMQTARCKSVEPMGRSRRTSESRGVWPTGGMDPEIATLQRHWTYEASVDVEGTSGNKDQLGHLPPDSGQSS